MDEKKAVLPLPEKCPRRNVPTCLYYSGVVLQPKSAAALATRYLGVIYQKEELIRAWGLKLTEALPASI